jgi:hypothetical protein
VRRRNTRSSIRRHDAAEWIGPQMFGQSGEIRSSTEWPGGETTPEQDPPTKSYSSIHCELVF